MPFLREANATSDLVHRLQSTLKTKGYKAGAVDGAIDADTIRAVNAYWAANNLPVDRYLNIETPRYMGVL